MALKSVISELNNRIEQLIEEHQKMSLECRKLRSERDSLVKENRQLEGKVRELDHELGRLQLSEGLAGSKADKEKARARVNHLMREVDKCIDLLTKQH